MFLPLFPLELVVFPGEIVKLHIFEPRYIQLINECRTTNITYGIPAYIDGALATYGTQMRLVSVEKTHDTGEMDIRTEGINAFHLDEFIREVPQRLYHAGNVTLLDSDDSYFEVTYAELLKQYTRLHELLKTGAPVILPKENPSYFIGQELGLTPRLKLQVLATERESDRQVIMIDYLLRLIPQVEKAHDQRARAKSNGHFKKFPKIDLEG